MRGPVRQLGVTLVELVVVLVIIGVVAGVGGARFFSAPGFAARGFADETLASLRHAHKLALASGCDVRLQMSASELVLSRWSSCQPASHGGNTTVFARPAGGGDYRSEIPAGISATAFDLYFDAEGEPHDRASGNPLSATLNLSIGSHSLSLAAETGYAWRP